MKILKGLLMIITAPVILVLTLFVWLCTGLIYISGLVLGLFSTVIALLGVAVHLTHQTDCSQWQPHRANQKCHDQQNHTIVRGIGKQHSHTKQSNHGTEPAEHQTGYVDQPRAEFEICDPG